MYEYYNSEKGQWPTQRFGPATDFVDNRLCLIIKLDPIDMDRAVTVLFDWRDKVHRVSLCYSRFVTSA